MVPRGDVGGKRDLCALYNGVTRQPRPLLHRMSQSAALRSDAPGRIAFTLKDMSSVQVKPPGGVRVLLGISRGVLAV